jgi:hypothetical protein
MRMATCGPGGRSATGVRQAFGYLLARKFTPTAAEMIFAAVLALKELQGGEID